MIPCGKWVPVVVWQPCELLYTCYLLLSSEFVGILKWYPSIVTHINNCLRPAPGRTMYTNHLNPGNDETSHYRRTLSLYHCEASRRYPCSYATTQGADCMTIRTRPLVCPGDDVYPSSGGMLAVSVPGAIAHHCLWHHAHWPITGYSYTIHLHSPSRRCGTDRLLDRSNAGTSRPHTKAPTTVDHPALWRRSMLL